MSKTTEVLQQDLKVVEIVEQWQQKLNVEMDKRKSVQRSLVIEKDRNQQLNALLISERNEKATLHQKIGSLEYQLAAAKVNSTHC